MARSPSSDILSSGSHILLVDLSEGYGGVDVRVFDTAAALHEAGCHYSVAVINNSRIHQQLDEANLATTPFKCSKYDPRLAKYLTQEISKHNYTIVDSHNSQSWLWSSLAARKCDGVKFISTIHLPSRRVPGGLKGWIEEQIIKRFYRIGGKFLVVSTEMVQYLLSLNIDSRDIALSYNAINLRAIQKQIQANDLLEQANWPSDSFVISIVGRLARQKGHDYLFNAIHQLRTSHPKLRCLVVGDGKLRNELEQLAESLGISSQVYFAGFRTDIPSILNHVDAFCLPSRGEGLPYAMLEACALKLPILVSRTDAIEELFTHKQTAYLVNVGKVDEIATGLRWMMENTQAASKMGESTYQFVDTQLNLPKMIKETFSFYRTVST